MRDFDIQFGSPSHGWMSLQVVADDTGLNDPEAKADEQLVLNDSWTADYYQDGTQEQNERLLFS